MRDGILRHVTIGLLAASLLSGCATTIRVGIPPRTDRVRELKVGVSTTKDVLLALGEPRGRGEARSSVVNEPRKILYYEYMEAEGVRIGLKLLVVFLREDRYDGHLWFSSSQLLEEAKR